MTLGVGRCAHCGAHRVTLVGLKATGSASGYRANLPACAVCFRGMTTVDWEDDDDDPTTLYRPGELDALKKGR